MIIIDVVDDEITTPGNQVRLNRSRVTTSGYGTNAPEYHRACDYHHNLLEVAHTARMVTHDRLAREKPADSGIKLVSALNRLATILTGWF